MAYGPQSGYTPPGGSVSISAGANIQAVVDAHGAGTVYALAAGYYREQMVTLKTGDSLVGSFGAILSGARLLTSWTADGSDFYVDAQTQGSGASGGGECQAGYSRCGYVEDVFVDNVALLHVSSRGALGPGKWFFDYGADKIYVRDNPSGHTVETSVTQVALDGSASGVTIRNLVVEKYASAAQNGAVKGGTGWTIQDCDVMYNHGMGIAMADGRMISNCRANHNGQMGIGGSSVGATVDGTEIAFNNAAHYDPAWEAGGTKFTYSSDLHITNNFVHHNAGPGIWLDIDNDDFHIDGNTCEDNWSPNASAAPGIFIEISYGGAITNNSCSRNGCNFSEWIWGAGILIAASGGSGLDISGNTCVGNAHGISLIQQTRVHGDGVTPSYVQNVDVHDNTIWMRGGALTGGVQDSGSAIFSTRGNSFHGNTYHLDTSFNHFAWNNATLTETGWKAAGMDTDGTFTYDGGGDATDCASIVGATGGSGGGGGGGASLPAGTLYMSGYGDGPDGERFISPTGSDLGQPDTGFFFGGSPGGFVRMSDGNIAIAGSGSGPSTAFTSSGAGVIDGTDISQLIEAITPNAYIGGFCLAADASGNYYTGVMRFSGGIFSFRVARFSPASDTATDTWEMAYDNTLYQSTLWAMAVNPAGDTLYVWLRGQFAQPDANKYKIHIFDLTGAGAYVGKLDDAHYTQNAPGFMSLQVNASSEIIASYRNDGASGTDGVIRRYSSAGSILNTYTPTGTGNTSNPMCTALDHTGTGFWYWTYTDDAATSSSAAYEHLAWAGTILHGPFYPEDGAFEFDSPFTVLSITIGTEEPPPSTTAPPPVIPSSTPCCATESGGGVPNAGPVLPPIDPGWIESCEGGGVVPTAADLTNTEAWDA